MSLKEELSQAGNEVSLWISTFIALWIHDSPSLGEYSRHCGIKFKSQAGGHMFNQLSRNWQLLALCGLAAYFLGTIALCGRVSLFAYLPCSSRLMPWQKVRLTYPPR
jgi:hypothetical protein